jgi:tetratricopeptide (TPR) repeat protein
MRDRRARIAEERGDLQTAIQSALESLQIQPFRLSTRYLLAGMLSRLPGPRAHEFAIEQCRRIEELAPDYADVTYNLGQLYLAAGQVSEALPYLRRAAQINPYNMEHIVALASALHAVGQDDEALNQLERAVQMQPENHQTRELLRRIQKEQKP